LDDGVRLKRFQGQGEYHVKQHNPDKQRQPVIELAPDEESDHGQSDDCRVDNDGNEKCGLHAFAPFCLLKV
jgi:hypothetical protein